MTAYGPGFDSLAHRWAIIENEHDKIHADRDECRGVGGCTMQAAAYDLRQQMTDELKGWRGRVPGAGGPEPERSNVVTLRGSALSQVKRDTLRTVLETLDGWIEGAHGNHDAMGHGGRENIGEECWRIYSPSDIRRMINDAAREVGIVEFPAPPAPSEDQW